jgi:gluconate kinase/fido (protein-threonine AMPylation protein)
MSTSTTANRAPVCTKEQQLRTAIALNRAIVLTNGIGKKLTLDPTELETAFQTIHRTLFSDGITDMGAAPQQHEKSKALHRAIEDILFAPNGLLHTNSNYAKTLHKEALAGIFAHFYEAVHKIKPYDFGNKLTLDVFLTALTHTDAYKNTNPSFQIDFRRLDASNLAVFHNAHATHDDLKRAFMQALDPSVEIQRPLPNADTSVNYPSLPEQKVRIGTANFLSHEMNGGKYLVTVNGELVPLEKYQPLLEKHLYENNMLSEFPPVNPKDIVGHLKGTEFLHDKPLIDGIPQHSLLCLDINIMSGLRAPSHQEVLNLIAQKHPQNPTITALNRPAADTRSKEEFLSALLGTIDDPLLKKKVSVAYDHVNANVKRLDELVEEKLRDIKKPNGTPKFCITQGGSGSGKSLVKGIFTDQCGAEKNFIETSLDEYRKDSDIYKVLQAANHHADDYKVVAPFGNALRDWVAEEAKKRGLNVLYDCSGVEYKGRYDTLVKGFKKQGYDTQMVSVEASLHNAIDRLMHRYHKDGRAMPWHLMIEKHVNMPLSFMDAVRDKNLDKVSLIADDGNKQSRYLIAETFKMPSTEVGVLKAQKKNGLGAAIGGMLQRADSLFGVLSKAVNEQADPVDLNPAKGDENQSFFAYDSNQANEKRVLAVYNVGRMAGMAEKGLLNPHAASPQNLLHTPENMPFYMPRAADGHEGAWKLRLLNQPPRAAAPGK